MNTRTPLAAALLMLASSVTAQPLSSNGGQFGGGNSNPGFSLGSMTDPSGPFGPTQLLGTSPDVQWADPVNCNRIPCRTVDSPKPAGDQKALEERMAAARALNPKNTIVDMGDGTSFGIVFPDGTISIDNGMSCGIPRPMTPEEKTKVAAQTAKAESKKADQEQMDKSINSDKSGMSINDNSRSINGDGTGANPPDGAKGSPSPSSPNPAAPGGGSAAPGGGYDDGRSIADISSFSGDDGSSGGGSFGGGSFGGGSAIGGGSSGGGVGASGQVKAEAYSGVKAKAEAESAGITYLGLLPHQANIERLGKAFQGGQLTDLPSSNAPVSNRLAEPPVDEKFVGKIQVSANSAAGPDGK